MDCSFCGKDQYPQNPCPAAVGAESESITIGFDSGRVYSIPSNLFHLIVAHEFEPPTAFVGDVMNATPLPVEHLHPAIVGKTIVIGASSHYPIGQVPAAMPWRLKTILDEYQVKTA